MKYALLLKCAQFLERPWFSGLHSFVRKLEIEVLGPSFFFLVRFPKLGRFKIIFRNSALEAPNFQFLWSDLDSSIIISKDCRPRDLEKFKNRYLALRSIFIFIGEIEIYEKAEFQKLQEFELKNDGDYQFIRLIRKLKWMNDIQNGDQIPYHHEKAKRAIRVTQSKIQKALALEADDFQLHLALSNWIRKRFAQELAVIEQRPQMWIRNAPHVWSDYWGYSFSEGLSGAEISLLLSIVPDGFAGSKEIMGSLQSLRDSIPGLKKCWFQNLTIESLRLKAWIRAQKHEPEWCSDWLVQLMGWQIEKSDEQFI